MAEDVTYEFDSSIELPSIHRFAVEPPHNALTRFSQQNLGGESFWTTMNQESLCLPVAFYSLCLGYGYVNPRYEYQQQDLQGFVAGSLAAHAKTENDGWLRPKMSEHLRQRYQVPVVSWQTGRNTTESLLPDNLDKMYAAGYIGTADEERYFREYIVGKSIADIISDETPVIVTVKPGFAKNGSAHSLIIDRQQDDYFHVIDPNDHNTLEWFSTDYVMNNLTGACSVILPQDPEALSTLPVEDPTLLAKFAILTDDPETTI